MDCGNHRASTSLPTALIAVLICISGCSTSSPPRNPNLIGSATDIWGLARARVEATKDGPEAVVIDVQMLDHAHYPEISRAAIILARGEGVVTIDHRIKVNLPETEGFQGTTYDGNLVTYAEGYDPALSRVGDTLWRITIPLRSDQARAALRNGGTIIINPNRSDGAGSLFPGLAFQW